MTADFALLRCWLTALLLVCSLWSISAVYAQGTNAGGNQVGGEKVPSDNPPNNQKWQGFAQRPPIGPQGCKFDTAMQDNMTQSDEKNEAGADNCDQFFNMNASGPNLRQKQKEAKIPNHNVPNQCSGAIDKDGNYCWQNCPKVGKPQCGKTNNPPLTMPGDQAQNLRSPSAVNIPFYEHMVEHTVGLPVHAHSAAISVALNEVYRNSLSQAIRGREGQIRQDQSTKVAQSADTQGGACQEASQAAYSAMQEYLQNVANENAGTPVSSRMPDKPISGAIWMVQQMYKQVYLPMALLLLLPGAALTQVKGMVSAAMLGSRDEDAASPIAGLIRAMMAIFLIPTTQLIVSYCVDTGNSMMYCVTTELKKNGRIERINSWMKEQAFASKPEKMDNHIKPQAGESDSTNPEKGKFSNASAKTTVQEKVSGVGAALQNCFNTVNNACAEGLGVLNAFQLVMISYLFLLGPIAAAFFAWPAGIGKDLFKRTFSSWLDGVVVLCLWKFWWCVVLLCMAVRLETETIDPTVQYELYYYTAFMAMLAFVPFSPFEFRPGDIVSHALEKAQQHAGKGGGGGGGGNKGGSQSGGNQNRGEKAAPPPGGPSDSKSSPASKGNGASTENSSQAVASASPIDAQMNPEVAPPPGSTGGGPSGSLQVAVDMPPPPGVQSESETHHA